MIGGRSGTVREIDAFELELRAKGYERTADDLPQNAIPINQYKRNDNLPLARDGVARAEITWRAPD